MNQVSLENRLILGLGQDIHMMSLEHLIVTEIKKVFFKKTMIGDVLKGLPRA